MSAEDQSYQDEKPSILDKMFPNRWWYWVFLLPLLWDMIVHVGHGLWYGGVYLYKLITGPSVNNEEVDVVGVDDPATTSSSSKDIMKPLSGEGSSGKKVMSVEDKEGEEVPDDKYEALKFLEKLLDNPSQDELYGRVVYKHREFLRGYHDPFIQRGLSEAAARNKKVAIMVFQSEDCYHILKNRDAYGGIKETDPYIQALCERYMHEYVNMSLEERVPEGSFKQAFGNANAEMLNKRGFLRNISSKTEAKYVEYFRLAIKYKDNRYMRDAIDFEWILKNPVEDEAVYANYVAIAKECAERKLGKAKDINLDFLVRAGWESKEARNEILYSNELCELLPDEGIVRLSTAFTKPEERFCEVANRKLGSFMDSVMGELS